MVAPARNIRGTVPSPNKAMISMPDAKLPVVGLELCRLTNCWVNGAFASTTKVALLALASSAWAWLVGSTNWARIVPIFAPGCHDSLAGVRIDSPADAGHPLGAGDPAVWRGERYDELGESRRGEEDHRQGEQKTHG